MNLLAALKASVAHAAALAVSATLEAGGSLGVELVADAKELGGEILTAAKAELDKVEGQVEDTFLSLTQKYGGIASGLVTDLWGPQELGGIVLGGNAKANLAAEQLVAKAAADGITIAENHASSIIQNAFLGVKDVVSQLTAKAASAIA